MPWNAFRRSIPTSAIAVLTVAGDWKTVELGAAALIEFHVPR